MQPVLPALTIGALKKEVAPFVQTLSVKQIPDLFGTTDGKAVGTYVEQMFRAYLRARYVFTDGNSASVIDLPELGIDLKATAITQPQSSCPYKDASQKVYGLGYHVLVFVYEKQDDPATQTAQLVIRHAIFVDQARTGDFQTTTGILKILDNHGNKDGLIAFFEERNLPIDDIGKNSLAERVLKERPSIGFLTISNALQWRLQYSRAIEYAGKQDGIEALHV